MIRHQPGYAGRTFERIVVMHDDGAVARQVHIELETVRAEGQAVVKGGNRILGTKRRPAKKARYDGSPSVS